MSNAENFDERVVVTEQENIDRLYAEREEKRSAVRRRVTYWVIIAYLGTSSGVIAVLMWAGRYEVAIGVLGGVAGLAGSITGFWFGSRKPETRSQNS